MKKDPEWVAIQNRKRCERYYKQKNELNQIEIDKELINYVTASRYKIYRRLCSKCDKLKLSNCYHEMRMIYFFFKI